MLDIRELMNLNEAYAEVYAPQELTEEQVWEEVETWVNSLLEEGYDLSDYTWEEMFEAYIEEQGGKRGAAVGNPNVNTNAYSAIRNLGNTLLYGNAAGKKPEAPGTRNRNVRGGRPIKPSAKPTAPVAPTLPPPRPAAAPVRPSASRPTAPAAPTLPPPRPAAAPARPAAAAPAAPARPAVTAPAAPAAKPSAMDQWAKANPRLAQAQQIRKQGGSRAEVNKSLYNKGTAAATSTPTVVKAGFDLFDVVKGYLIGEGYADTEEAALAIMANMSEEWREDIVELYKGKHGQSEKEYMDDRSQGGKMISGDSKESGASYSHRSFRGQGKPAKPGMRQPAQGRMDSGTRADIQYRKANLKNR